MLDCNSERLKATSKLVLANSNLIYFKKKLCSATVCSFEQLETKLDLLIFPGGISVLKF